MHACEPPKTNNNLELQIPPLKVGAAIANAVLMRAADLGSSPTV